MKIIDVTLRDGGFVSDFNWELEQAKFHVKTMSTIGVHIIELGYWKQTQKSNNPFYNMDEDTLNFLTSDLKSNSIIAVMIDFSYCSKNIKDYPKLGETHMRLALEREYMYAREFPFVEYGLDLGIMGELEKGVKIESLSRTEYDASPPPDVKKKVNA